MTNKTKQIETKRNETNGNDPKIFVCINFVATLLFIVAIDDNDDDAVNLF